MFSLRAMRSLRARLLLSAALIGTIAVLASSLTIRATTLMSDQLQSIVAAEQRIQHYSTLANNIGSVIVVLYEAAQSDLDPQLLDARLAGLVQNTQRYFTLIREDLDRTVAEADDIDEQSRRATRSIGVARMEALFNTSLDRIEEVTRASGDATQRASRIQGQINAFSIGFDPLLNTAITEERRFRDEAVARVATLRQRLTRVALAVGALAVLLVSGFYLVLVRPQLGRLDRLRLASEQIGREEFEIDLPRNMDDEIGRVFAATQEMAEALARRKSDVKHEWGRLNQTIAERTEALRKANDALAKRDEDRRRFFADVSHELRTPLTVILMEAELALKSGAARDGPYGVIRSRAQRLNQRIDDLLRIARSETGMLDLETADFDLGEAAEKAVADMQSVAEAAGMVITLDAATAPVCGDRNWVRQVITGMLENAVRHARDGGQVRVEVGQEGDGSLVRVIDNGPGIPPDQLESVLDRFSQAGGAGASKGFGIGLSFARWIIEGQGGRITLTSPVPEERRLDDGTGTLVTVFLPRVSG